MACAAKNLPGCEVLKLYSANDLKTGFGNKATRVSFRNSSRSSHRLSDLSSRSFRNDDRSVARSAQVIDQVASSQSISQLEGMLDQSSEQGNEKKTLNIIIAGAGIGGLVLALAAKNSGMKVTVFERDMTAIRGEGQYRGPIQIQSNALGALEAVDKSVAEEIMEKGCVTGDRINGLVDGISGEWYTKFDTFTPAAEKGLPITRVISRMTLQEILAKAVGSEIIQNGTVVVDFEDTGSGVVVTLGDGSQVTGDLLVGADGIRSKVREKLLGPQEATYSDYTCYTGICDFTPADIDNVGYRVFLGHKQYFVSSDVGFGKMQWYAFYNEPAGGSDPPGKRKDRLMSLFGNWCDGVVDLIMATDEELILRRDIYDRIPIMSWGKGRVTLLGDSAHAMQPNMGQGGCMAIEDGYQLALDLKKAIDEVGAERVDVPSVLKQYENERRLRVGAIHGLARMAAIMASTYKAYLGEGLGPLSWLTKLRIPHPGRVGGQFLVKYFMPLMLQWVLGGNSNALEGRAPYCSIEDKANDNIKKWMVDDDALERATDADWFLVPAGERFSDYGSLITANGKQVFSISTQNGHSTIIGSLPISSEKEHGVVLNHDDISEKHARIDCENNAFYLTDLKSKSGTWIVRVDGAKSQVHSGQRVRLHPGDTLEFGQSQEGRFRVKLRKHSDY